MAVSVKLCSVMCEFDGKFCHCSRGEEDLSDEESRNGKYRGKRKLKRKNESRAKPIYTRHSMTVFSAENLAVD